MSGVVSARTRGRISVILIGIVVVAIALLVGTVFVTAGTELLDAAGVDVNQPLVILLLNPILLQGAGFVSVAFGFYWIYQRTIDDGAEYVSLREFVLLRWPSKPQLLFAVGGYLALFAVTLVVALASSLFGIASAENEIVTLAEQQPITLLLLAILSYLVVAPAEELLYRGIVQLHFREVLRPVLAIAMTSLIFAGSHIGTVTGSGSLTSLGGVFLISVILGALYEYTDNLAVPILMHGSYNATQFLLIYATIGT